MTILVRAGLPLTGGALVQHARSRGMPILVSANALARRAPRGHEQAGRFLGFRENLAPLEGLDVALDSSGFVAHAQRGGYDWSLESYVDLAASFPWAWWASMDACCEPEIADDAPVRRLRIAATAYNFGALSRLARRRGIAPPMPVLQGLFLSEYALSIDWMPLTEWPSLVGVGSMCRRPLHGPAGLLRIVEGLNELLPPNVLLHLFGVKSGALPYLNQIRVRLGDGTLGHSRVLSVDSASWDYQARTDFRTGRSMEIRIGYLDAWVNKQRTMQHASVALRADACDDASPMQAAVASSVREIAAERLAQAILDDVVDYDRAKTMLAQSACWGQAYAQQHGLSPIADRGIIENFLDDIGL